MIKHAKVLRLHVGHILLHYYPSAAVGECEKSCKCKNTDPRSVFCSLLTCNETVVLRVHPRHTF